MYRKYQKKKIKVNNNVMIYFSQIKYRLTVSILKQRKQKTNRFIRSTTIRTIY